MIPQRGFERPNRMAHGFRKFNYKHFIRKSHRYLGVFIGIQFILWTLGGLYFSWTNLDEIHGDHLIAHSNINLSIPPGSISPDEIVSRLRAVAGAAPIEKIYFVEVLGAYFYAVEHVIKDTRSTVLMRVKDGSVRPAVTSIEAGRTATDALAKAGEPTAILYLTRENVSRDKEYREKPLPAWAVTFEKNVSVYVSAETGQVVAVRTDNWRAFDLLWMFHTMDFHGRDNINNYGLRGFSILGIVTVLSGFSLFFVSSRFLGKFWDRRNVPRG